MKLVAGWSPVAVGSPASSAAEWIRRLDACGFDGLAVNDHVIGGAPERQRDGEKVHTIETPTTDPFVLLAYVAALTTRMELRAEVLVLPQRQTLVVAKQAAELDRLSGGRLQLGIGVGRNWMEYEALDAEFSTRGARIEEQVEVLRRVWTEPLVTFEGRWHALDRIGLNPRPERSIPIWMGVFVGGINDRVVRRAARLADGWLPQMPPGDELAALLERFRTYVAEADRSVDDVAIECVANIGPHDDSDAWRRAVRWFADHGATHVVCRPTGATGADYIELLCRWHDAVAPDAH